MIEVEVNNASAHAIDEARLSELVRAVLVGEGIRTAQVSVGVVDDKTIHRLNREYLGHDYATDVLSFSFERDEDQLNGELVISADTAARVAPEFGWSASDELLLYAAHGALHLVGYDDQDECDRDEMRSKERDYLGTVGLQPRYDER